MSFANPYSNLPDQAYWKRAVASVTASDVDPVVKVPFLLTRADRVATAGSCFAQHIGRQIRRRGFGFYLAEAPHPVVPPGVADLFGYGMFSARYGNVYTARQLLQLFRRAFGQFQSREDVWRGPQGEFLDPFRPTIQPDGHASAEDLRLDRDVHLSRVRHMFETLDVMVFTLGLTEAWERADDETVLPVCPGVVAVDRDAGDYRFANHSIDRVREDLFAFITSLRNVNPGCRIILTVSPVPLIATYAGDHVLCSTTYSKSVLRVAAEEAAARFPAVAYFPSFEIIVGQYNKGAYFEPDLRSVTAAGVAHVMRTFFRHYAAQEEGVVAPLRLAERRSAKEHEEFASASARVSKAMCDEELLDLAPREARESGTPVSPSDDKR